MRFSSAARERTAQPAPNTTPDDALSGVLLDLHAANVLLSAGIALNEHAASDTSFLINSLNEAESSRARITTDLERQARLAFAPAAGVKSSSLEDAKKTFRENADGVLKDIVDDANAVVNDVLEKLKNLDSGKIIEGINKLGESFQPIAAASKLIRQGLELLKRALDALSNLFGKKAFDSVKAKVVEIWTKFHSGEYTHDALAWAFNIKGTEERIAAVLGRGNAVDLIDNATNELPGLSDKYKANMNLLRSIMSAVVVAGTIVAFLQLAAPYIPIALASIYAAVIGATILVGMDYCDSGRILGWVRGVGQIANSINP